MSITTYRCVRGSWVALWGLSFTLLMVSKINGYEGNALYAYEPWLLGILVLLSFPSSMLFAAMASMVFNPLRGYGNDTFIDFFVGFGLFACGYLQWFVIPKELGSEPLTTLNLKPDETAAQLSSHLTPSPPPLTLPSKRTYEPPLRNFDEHGCTPLERALRDAPT